MSRAKSSDVDVVIPLFNGEKWIAETLEAVLGQTHPPAAVVVVDDGSTDGSFEIVRRYPSVRLLTNELKGANYARVMGLRSVGSPLIAFLDQDDLWYRGHLAVLTGLLRAHPSAVAAFTEIRAEPALEAGLFDPWVHFPYQGISTPSAVLMRRCLLMKIGGWPTSFPGVADAVTWLKLGAMGPFIRAAYPTLQRRLHETSYSRSLRSDNVEEYLQSSLAGSAHAIDFMQSIRGADASEVYRRRLAIFREILVAFDLTARGDVATTREHARRHSEPLADLSERELATLAAFALWFLEMKMLRIAGGKLELATRAHRCRSLSTLHNHLYVRLSRDLRFREILIHTLLHGLHPVAISHLVHAGLLRVQSRLDSWRTRLTAERNG